MEWIGIIYTVSMVHTHTPVIPVEILSEPLGEGHHTNPWSKLFSFYSDMGNTNDDAIIIIITTTTIRVLEYR